MDLKRLIARSEHTYFTLAVAIGVQPNTIYRWASGRAHPGWANAKKLAKELGVGLEDLGSALAKANAKEGR